MRAKFPAKIWLGWLLTVAVLPEAAWGARKAKPLPKFSSVAAVVKRHFLAMPHYQPGDMIARSDVKPIFDQLRMMGWHIADRKQIVSLLPDETNYVTRQLRTERGVKFMRKIASYPDGYERLYQLAALPKGRRLVYDLIHRKGGDEMIDYLTSSRGGKNLTKMLAKSPHGKNFGKPSGRIYTVEQLIERLKESYAFDQRTLAAKGKQTR